MPTAAEVVPNRSLTGTELKAILLRDFTAMLDTDGYLSSQIAYSRVSYDLRVRLHLDNPFAGDHGEVTISATSKESPRDTPLEGVTQPAPPLKEPSDKAVTSSRTRTRRIDSPNAARVEHGLPVQVSVRGQDGHLTDKAVKYPPDSAPVDPSLVTDTDDSVQQAAEWKGKK